jgi:uncharacterized protein
MGAVGGVVAVHQLAPTLLTDALPLVLAGIVIYTACARRVGLMDTLPTVSPGVFYSLAGIALGFVDGCVGAGGIALGHGVRHGAGV